MVDGMRVIAVIPAGRKRYLSILMKYMDQLKGVIDECRLWVNTTDITDLDAVKAIIDGDPQYYVAQELLDPKPEWSGNRRVRLIREFYPSNCEPGCVYIRFDDDICWIDVRSMVDLIRFRIQHPEFFLVYPAIINNGRTLYLHQLMGAAPFSIDGAWTGGKFDRYNLIKLPPQFGEVAHSYFFDHLSRDRVGDLRFGTYISRNWEKIPINCILWLGEEFAKFGGEVADEHCDFQEEIWLTEIAPRIANKHNAIYGECVVSHFAFNTQREYLESETNLLDYYEEIAEAHGAWPFKVF